MPERSKTPSSRKPAPSRLVAQERAFAVALESVRGDLRVVGEALQAQGDALQGFREEVGARFDEVDAQFRRVDARFDEVDTRFRQVDAEFRQVGVHFDRVDTDIGLLKSAVIENTRELRQVRAALDAKVDGE
jgi:tetrahydromethanopterin S-methyltransferase subunit G